MNRLRWRLLICALVPAGCDGVTVRGLDLDRDGSVDRGTATASDTGASTERDRSGPLLDLSGSAESAPNDTFSEPDHDEPDYSEPDYGEPARDASAADGHVPDDAGAPPSSLGDVLPFSQPSLSALRSSSRLVFAHWHQFPLSRDNADPRSDVYHSYVVGGRPAGQDKEARLRPLGRPVRTGDDWKVQDAKADILQAQAIGIDAFLMNFGGDIKNPWGYPTYVNYLKAAKALGTGFKIGPNVDCANGTAGLGSGTTIANNILRFLEEGGELKNATQWRQGGRFVFGSFNTFNCSARFWADLKARLKAGGLGDTFFISVALGGSYRADYDSVVDAWSDWGRKDPASAGRVNYAELYAGAGDEPIVASISHGDARIFMERPSIAYESEGSATLRLNWERAIATGADWAQLVTWNDIGEHAVFYPNTAEQFAFYDLTAYYISWFKTGRAPTINKDALYYFHRKGPVPPDIEIRAGSWKNQVELLAFLTAPGTLEIITSSGTTREEVPAGMHTLRAPLPSSGTPRFRLVRANKVVVELTSAFPIAPSIRRDCIYRAGGSLRAAPGAAGQPRTTCEGGGATPDGCLRDLTEPVWLVH